MLRALLLAPPGAGKGTQGDRVARRYGVPHIATGDLLRDNVARGTAVGLAARTYIDAGDLVPDDVVVQLVLERGEGPPLLDGFVLDGFPRTLEQAQRAHEWASVHDRTFHAVVYLAVPTDELVRRLLARGDAQGRSDDDAVTIHNRLDVYEAATAPLRDYYRDRGILVTVDGVGTVDDVADRVVDALGAVVP